MNKLASYVSNLSADQFPKKNILTPIGALTFGIFSICIAGAVIRWPSALSWVLISISLAPLIVSLWAYIFFAIRDPDRLQTEDYRIQKQYVASIARGITASDVELPPPGSALVSRYVGEE
jgi:hypothetical protein